MASSNARRPFPKSVDDFDNDERVSFSKIDNMYILEAEDGSEWEWNGAAQKWTPTMDEDLVEKQRLAYHVEGVEESEPVTRKRKKDGADGELNGNKKAKQEPLRKNTAIYVTNLPLDTTVEELIEVFSRCGVIAESLEAGEKRVKLYTDEKGAPKGEALITYFRPESVELAIDMLDDSSLRLGAPSERGNMRVAMADFSYKKEQHPAGEQPAKARTNKEKKQIQKRYTQMNNKLADWDDDDPQSALPDRATSSRADRVVIMKHMFTPEELEEDPGALLEIKEDVREECEQFGPVTNVVLFDREPTGVMTVRFGNADAARACVARNNGRSFAGRIVEAYIADGSERFKKSGTVAKTLEEEKAEEQRLEKFGDWLDAQDKD